VLKQVSTVAVVFMLLSGCSVQKKSEPTAAEPSLRNKAYQATYSSPENFAYQTQHIYSDGAGHVRMDISGDRYAPTMVNVLDLNTGESILWSEEVPKYVRRPSEPTDPLVMRVQMETMPKNGEDLGVRIISGHRSHGWKGMADTEVWFDEEYGCPVLAIAGGITTKLVAFSSLAPDPSVFQPPPGFSEAPTPRRYRQSDDSRIIHDIELHMH